MKSVSKNFRFILNMHAEVQVKWFMFFCKDKISRSFDFLVKKGIQKGLFDSYLVSNMRWQVTHNTSFSCLFVAY